MILAVNGAREHGVIMMQWCMAAFVQIADSAWQDDVSADLR
ncbi:hypothetical protein [Aeromonas cavernicola]|nr:hypothetical protein [Aeromonas cavernicola]